MQSVVLLCRYSIYKILYLQQTLTQKPTDASEDLESLIRKAQVPEEFDIGSLTNLLQ